MKFVGHVNIRTVPSYYNDDNEDIKKSSIDTRTYQIVIRKGRTEHTEKPGFGAGRRVNLKTFVPRRCVEKDVESK